MRRFAEEDNGSALPDEDLNYLLLPARLLGYCFSTKVWAQFHVNKVEAIEVPDAEKAMQKLIFPDELKGIKEDLRILIEQHGSTKVPMIVDPVEGKGAGLVVLLHGKKHPVRTIIQAGLTSPKALPV